MNFDANVTIERVKSESMRAVFSIQEHRLIEPSYFNRFRDAVQEAMLFFEKEATVPLHLIEELKNAARIIRNEAVVFPERTSACNEMATWLDEVLTKLENKSQAQ